MSSVSSFVTSTERFLPKKKSYKALLLVVLVGGGGALLLKLLKDQKKARTTVNTNSGQPLKRRPAVDRIFFKRLISIFKIVVGPREALTFAILTFLLLSRTWLSVAIAEIIGQNAQSLVSRDWKSMLNGIIKFALITIPAACVNSGLKYFSAMLSLRFRVKLSEHIHDEYLKGVNFYKACNLGGPDRIDNADQRVTADIEKFSDAISELYTTLFKPLLDVILFTTKLSQLTGWQGPTFMYSYFVVSSIIKRMIMPSFGSLVAKESELEGIYRTAHQRLITNSEEIAFYDGSSREKTIINNSLKNLERHVSYSRYLRSLVGVFDGLLVKYWASIVGYVTLSSPIYLELKGNRDKSTTELTKDYIRSSQYLGNLNTAVTDLVLVGNKLTTIAGYTSRVSELLEQVKHLSRVGTKPFDLIPNEDRLSDPDGEEMYSPDNLLEWLKDWRRRCDVLRQQQMKRRASLTLTRTVPGGGTYIEGEHIEFQGVDIVSPEGKLLVQNLNITVNRDQHVMVTGPNGAGKSSLFRIIGELWPLHSGIVTKPRKEDVLFVPQKPYLVLGTLRDQIIYPHSREQMKAIGITDEDLSRLLAVVDPTGVILKNWKWDDVKDWFHAFSGGQKQRVAMARLFYHRPQYAILDECTSAVSDEVEDKIYQTCTKLGITLFTVSHRRYLRRYHNFQLKFEGKGGAWHWSVIHDSEVGAHQN